MTGLLRVDNVSLGFAPTGSWARLVRRRTRPAPILDDVCLAIDRGGAVAIMGRSGSGKSTLARIVAGLLPPDSGDVLLDGRSRGAFRGRRARLAWHRAVQLVQQDTRGSLDPRMRVGAQIEEAMAIHGLGTRAGRRTRAADLMDRVGLPEALADRRPGALSGGQRQRIVIARALALAPRLLVCDEPTSALDDAARERVLGLLEDLRRRDGLGLMIVTHDPHVADRLADLTLHLVDGRLSRDGAAAQDQGCDAASSTSPAATFLGKSV